MGAQHVWNCNNDFEYCTLDGCKILDNTIVLDHTKTDLEGVYVGSVISDIRDSTIRLVHYDEVIPNVLIPVGTSLNFFVRTGLFHNYTVDTWTDWVGVTADSPMVEFTLSLNNMKIIADYDVDALVNLHYSDDPKFYKLASMLNLSFLNSLDENNTAAVELYEALWSAIVDISARSGFAKTDFDPASASFYSRDSSCRGNIIILSNKLPGQNAPVVIEYESKHFILNSSSKRFLQWKCELTSDALVKTPVIREFVTNYRMNYYDQMINAFPGLFRRL